MITDAYVLLGVAGFSLFILKILSTFISGCVQSSSTILSSDIDRNHAETYPKVMVHAIALHTVGKVIMIAIQISIEYTSQVNREYINDRVVYDG